jgi:hypothetical protein
VAASDVKDPIVNTDIEQIILSCARSNWQKTAMVIARAEAECQRRSIEISHEALADHLKSLVTRGQLEAVGNLSLWRHSEVRIPH